MYPLPQCNSFIINPVIQISPAKRGAFGPDPENKVTVNGLI